MEVALVLLAVAILVPLLWEVTTHNRFVHLENLVRDSWANMDVALKRRHDLIPNLVQTVKGYAAHERETLEQVTELRNRATAARSPVERAETERPLARAVHRLMAVGEGYPELRASAAFRDLQQELVDTEDRIAAARRFYNANVRDFNVLRESFPSSLLAGGRSEKPFFEIEDAGERAPVRI